MRQTPEIVEETRRMIERLARMLQNEGVAAPAGA
jgi:hypothetical protein